MMMMNRMSKWLMSIGVALGVAVGGGYASAGHNLSTIEEGAVKVMSGSFCRTEDSVVAIFDKLKQEGMPSSVVLFEEFIDVGMCVNTSIGYARVIRLVVQVENSIAVEVRLTNGTTLYLIVANAEYVLRSTGDPV